MKITSLRPFFRRGPFSWLGFFAPFAVAICLLAAASSGQAQTTGNLSGISDQVPDLQQLLGRQGNGNSSTGNSDSTNFLTPVQNNPAVAGLPQPPSRLEQIMSAQAGTRLELFGYREMGSGRIITIPQTGAVQDDYILGPGDQIVVALRGQENSQLTATVDRNGQLVLPRLSPIPAAGRNFGSFRQDVETAVHRAYVATDAFVSIARVRQISVLVSGEVNVPGSRLVTGLSSVADALLLSGGVKKTGSLRSIRLLRAGHSYTIDLYSELTSNGGGSGSMRLTDGDRIVVPALGSTVAVAGLVRLPGIYELPSGQQGMSVRNLLKLAGGEEVRGRYRLSLMRIDSQGRSVMAPVTDQAEPIHDSEILFLQIGADQTTGRATLSGGTGLAGAYPVASGSSLAEILRAPGALGESPYTLFGIIVRKDPRTLLRHLIAFTPVAVLSGTENEQIQSDDTIRPLTVSETSLLSNVVRAYLEKLAADQNALRNPLMDQGLLNAPPGLPTAALPLTAALPAGIPASAIPASAANLIPPAPTLPVSKVDELSFALSDLINAPSDVQRADILSLMDLRAPGTLASGSAESLAEQQDQLGEQPLTPQAIRDQAGAAQALAAANVASAAGAKSSDLSENMQPVTKPAMAPAQNFQDIGLNADRYAANREIKTFGELSRQLNIDPLVLINFLIEHRARLDGAVRGPGSYFVGPSVELADLVQAAGGTVDWADDSGVELITTAVDHRTGQAATRRETLPLGSGQLASYMVHPHDTLRFNPAFTDVGIGAVTVQGEVRAAGSYPITRGEHLSDLLARAGGLTNTAYPNGTVFLRKSAAQAEHDGYVRDAAEIQNELVEALTRIGNDKIDPSSFAALQVFVNELRNQKAVGRIAIEADPSVLAAKPELDPLLEAGDLVYIPQRPSTVSVLGQVAQPGSFPYRAGRSVQDYIDLAGGYSAISDDSMTFIVLPNGSARKVEKSWLSFNVDALPPGSTIVVPRDVTPLNTRQLILDISSIFSQFAVSIASMAVLAKQ